MIVKISVDETNSKQSFTEINYDVFSTLDAIQNFFDGAKRYMRNRQLEIICVGDMIIGVNIDTLYVLKLRIIDVQR